MVNGDAMQLDTKQWALLVLMIIADVILVALSILALVPMWAGPNPDLLVPDLNLLMSPLAILPMVLTATIVFLMWIWPTKVDKHHLILPLRLVMGYEFLHGGVEKLLDTTYLASPGLIGFGASSAPSEWTQYVLGLMLGNYQFFLLLIAVGELLIGLSMYLGIFTRLGAIGGLVMQWTFLFLLGWLSISTFGINFVGAVVFAVLGSHQAGRLFGIDQLLGPRLDTSTNPLIRLLAWLTN